MHRCMHSLEAEIHKVYASNAQFSALERKTLQTAIDILIIFVALLSGEGEKLLHPHAHIHAYYFSDLCRVVSGVSVRVT